MAVEAEFLYIPSAVICTFIDHTTYANNIEVVRRTTTVDVARLDDTVNTYRRIIRNEITAQQGIAALDAIAGRPHSWPKLFNILAYGVTSVCVSPMAFEARPIDFIPIFVLGSYLGFLKEHVVPRCPNFAHVFEIAACISIAFISRAIGSIKYPNSVSEETPQGQYVFCFSAVAQSSIVLILPGISILHSALELQSKNMISGSVRMV